MNNVCLCVGNYAKTPYYVKISDISLYSIEELRSEERRVGKECG